MKRPGDVRGRQIHCPDFQQCPVCYGCRSYDTKYEECRKCGSDKKNICNKQKHRPDLMAQLVTRPEVVI